MISDGSWGCRCFWDLISHHSAALTNCESGFLRLVSQKHLASLRDETIKPEECPRMCKHWVASIPIHTGGGYGDPVLCLSVPMACYLKSLGPKVSFDLHEIAPISDGLLPAFWFPFHLARMLWCIIWVCKLLWQESALTSNMLCAAEFGLSPKRQKSSRKEAGILCNPLYFWIHVECS